MELFLKDESELFASKGEVSKEEAFELHRDYCGQSLQNHELEAMYENACSNPSEDGPVDMIKFL